MRASAPQRSSVCFVLNAVSVAALLATGVSAHAGEGFKLRQSPIGAFGGEMAAPADNPGFFGTASLTLISIDRIADGNGNDLAPAARTIPLATGTPTGGAVPSGTFSLNVPAGTIKFKQTQTQINLVGGYLTEATYGNGRIAFAVNLPIIKQSRTYSASQPLGTVSPTPAATLPAAARGAITAVATATNNQVQAGVAATANGQNESPSGIGDTELSLVWLRHQGPLKVAAGASLYVPTGSYDKNRGPNPGFGNFYTLRPGVAVSYALNPSQSDTSWDSGVTVAGRVSYGVNTKNKDTDYRSGNFLYLEGGITKVSGSWAYGANLLAIQQVTDDTGTGAAADGNRLRNRSFGPFVSYKLPGKDAGFNLHYTQNFGSRNSLVARALQLRFIKAW